MATAQVGGVAATVVIITKNRKDELRQAIRSALAQDIPVEVLVIDDASTDGTSAMVRAEFPAVTLETAPQSLGYIAQRNRGAELARAPIIFSIDDDAAFASPRTVRQTLAEFDHPRIGAVAIPFINVNQNSIVHQRARDRSVKCVLSSYIGTAHALRRDLFQTLGRYRGFLIHQGEETDYCLRMINAGFFVRGGNADPIHHFESPRRDIRRLSFYGHRNNILVPWCNTPSLYLPWHWLSSTARGVIWGFKVHHLRYVAYGLLMGYVASLAHFRDRRPISRKAYRLYRALKLGGAQPMEDALKQLPPTTRQEAR